MDTSTNPGSPRIYVRLFLLVAVTVFFGLLWSSDQDYQAREIAARSWGPWATDEPEIAANSPAVQTENAASAPVAPFAPSSWIAPSFASAPGEDAIRTPIVAPKIAAPQVVVPPIAPSTTVTPDQAVAREALVSVIVVFRTPHFRVEDAGTVDTTNQADASGEWPLLEANYRALARWIDQVRFEIAGQTCEMRWQMRRAASSAGGRVLALIRQEFGTERDWQVLVQKFARGAFGPLDPMTPNAAAKHAAVPDTDTER